MREWDKAFVTGCVAGGICGALVCLATLSVQVSTLSRRVALTERNLASAVDSISTMADTDAKTIVALSILSRQTGLITESDFQKISK